jgi:dethiobiotin synthetase
MSYFVVGTDTDVGKTLISCGLLEGFAAQGLSVVGMKPVSAGVNELGVNEDVRLLRAAGNVEAATGQINPYRFEQAIAPHLAARFVGVNIDLSRIVESYRELATQADVVIVEGAGGFRVPLNNHQDGADLANMLNLPLILVVGMRLGCLNHALLTVESILSRSLRLAGWVANCVYKDMSMLDENIAALHSRIAAPLLGVVPYCQNQPDAREMAKYLDLALLSR